METGIYLYAKEDLTELKLTYQSDQTNQISLLVTMDEAAQNELRLTA